MLLSLRLPALALISALPTLAHAQEAATPTPAEAAPAGAISAEAAPAGEAAAPDAPIADTRTSEERDPLEGFNRAMWGFNQGLDTVVLKPVATVYRTIAPRPARRGLSRVLANLSEPFSAINALLQGKPDRAFNSLGRFLINSTIGVGGLADHATGLGLKPTPEDFGQTLAAWGVRRSTYLVLPLLGPSTIRDGIGSGVAQFADPYRIALREYSGLSTTERYGVTAFEIVDARTNLIDSGADALLNSSADPYAVARSAYLQRRAAQIADQDEDSGPAVGVGSEDAAMDAALKEIDTNAPEGESPAPAEPPAAMPEPAAKQ